MIDLDRLEYMDLAELIRLRNACSQQILRMRRTQGLRLQELLMLLEETKGTLADQGKKWYSLESWEWRDGQIRFWLNPTNKALYKPGWYSIDELIAWARDVGPIMVASNLPVEIEEDVLA